MATVSFYLDTRREKKDGTFPVKLQVRHKGQIMLCTDFCATPETWTGTEYNKNAKNHKAKNVAIRNLINRVEMLLVILDDNQKLKGMSDKALKDYILKSIKNESIKNTPHRHHRIQLRIRKGFLRKQAWLLHHQRKLPSGAQGLEAGSACQ